MTVHHIFHLNPERFDQHELEKKRERELDQINLLAGHSSEVRWQDRPREQARSENTTGRNEPCTCGSGKKYKKCHGAGK